MKLEVVRTWKDIESSSNPAVRYTVQMYSDGSLSCNCPRWIKRKERICPHVNAIKLTLQLGRVDEAIAESRAMFPNEAKHATKRHIEKVED